MQKDNLTSSNNSDNTFQKMPKKEVLEKQDQYSLAISVVIIAYNRQQFLTQAIESALKQTLKRSLYEIIVVKNFSDVNDEERYSELGVRFFTLPDGPVSKYIIKGIEVAKGEVISFLDDDDLFDAEKLQYVQTLFDNHPNLVYLHNGREYFPRRNRGLNILPKGYIKAPLSFRIDDRGDSLSKYLRIIFKQNLAINLSSVSVRSYILRKQIYALISMVGATDYFIFFLCLQLQGKEVMFVPTVLTKYRLSESATHFFQEYDLSVKALSLLALQQRDSLSYIFKQFTDHSCSTYLNMLITQWELILAMVSHDDYKRQRLLKTLLRYFLANAKLRRLFVIPLMLLSFVGILSQKVSLTIFLGLRSLINY